MEDYLTQYPEIDAVSILERWYNCCCATAIKNAGRDKEIVIIGSDADTIPLS